MSDASTLHNVAVVGHGGCGKTTLMESLLFKAGAISRKGSVNDGTSIGLVEEEEKERKITLNSNLFQADWKGQSINFLDSPGYTDFIAGTVSATTVVEVHFTGDVAETEKEVDFNFVDSDSFGVVVVQFGCSSGSINETSDADIVREVATSGFVLGVGNANEAKRSDKRNEFVVYFHSIV